MAKVSLRAYNREIETMIDRGQFDEAIAHCRHILKSYPKHLETYRLLGKAYLESKRYGDAVDIFSRILATVPNDFVAQVGMSIIRDEENKLDEAIWHMERAFETQPSNPAIQAELQRLYARRDGVKPPRIRMTRGALANMYVQGELYPQAISEIKNVLKDDPERADMQALLARALYKSGQKNEAADVASSLLRRYPYSLDANRVLVEILGSEHSENAEIYRQRVYELDPYAALVTASVFLSNQVSDAAVNVERLEWDGQPVALSPDWADTKAISPETGEQPPDWLGKPVDEGSYFGSSSATPESIFGAPPAPEPTTSGWIESEPTSIFGASAPAEQPADEIPDFMKAAGWAAATGAFDESKPIFSQEEEAKPAEPVEQADLPDWVRAMKPVEPAVPAQQEDEEIPEWIKTIGMGAIAAKAFEKDETPPEEKPMEAEESTQWLSSTEAQPQAGSTEDLSSDFAWLDNLDETKAAPGAVQSEEPDWLKGIGLSKSDTFANQAEEPDWLKGLGESEPGSSTPQSEEPDWLKELGLPEETQPTAPAEEPDWLKGLGETAPAAETPTDEQDWMKDLGGSETTPTTAQDEEMDWLKSLSETTPAESQASDQDWMKDLAAPEPEASTAQEAESDWLQGLGEPKSTPAADGEDVPDWLKGLALAGGAAAVSHLARDEEPKEEKEVPAVPEPGDSDFVSQLSEERVLPTTPDSTASDLDRLGMSNQEQDDSFAWLESLAAKQGTTEGLLTTPEERSEEEPDWVKQAKGLQTETPVPQADAEQPSASLEEIGKSEQDQEDAFAWLEGLAAKQGATEGLLTTPEERSEEEPEWVKQAKDLSAQEVSPEVTTTPTSEEAPAVVQMEQETQEQEPAAVDEVEAWLRDLEGSEKPVEPESAADETAIWLKGLEEREAPQAEEPVETPGTDLPEWMQNIEVAPEEKSPLIFAEEAELSSTWMPHEEQPATEIESKAEEDTLPSWLGDLDQEEAQTATPSEGSDLPAWLLAEEETAPAAPEPTLFSDWKPTEAERQESVPEQQPETEHAEPTPLPTPPFEMAEAETVLEPEQPQAEPEPVPVMEVQETVPQSQRQAMGAVVIPTVDPVLNIARDEMSRSNIPGALDSYGKLIKKARYLDEVIYDLREALYRFPVDVNLWQSLGDAYMRANRLQDALDAYTKAEELLR